MSVESIAAVLNADLDVTPTAKLVLVGIANHDGDGGAWPSVATLARYAGVSTRSVQRALSDLEKARLIVRHLNDGGTRKTPDHTRPNRYEITLSGGDASVTPPPDTSVTPPVTPASPEPSIEPSGEPSTPHSPPAGGDVDDETFNLWWEQYPRKVGKPTAKRAFRRKVREMTVPQIIAMGDGTQAWITFWQRSRTEQRFIPHPTTFLNQERYNDTPPDPREDQTSMGALRRLAEEES